jgi:hypothetical protein
LAGCGEEVLLLTGPEAGKRLMKKIWVMELEDGWFYSEEGDGYFIERTAWSFR